jgi:secreted trypsin-like serine protease
VSTKTGKVVGIVSYVKDAENGKELGYNDCKSNVPVVATRISSYLDWISEKCGLKFD